MLEKSASCKSSSIIDHLVVEESLENEESKGSSEYDSSRDSEDSEFEIDTAEVVLTRKQLTRKLPNLRLKSPLKMPLKC